MSTTQDTNVAALNDALETLEKFGPRRRRIVELKFFGGLEVAEIAEVLSVSPRTVARECGWRARGCFVCSVLLVFCWRSEIVILSALT